MENNSPIGWIFRAAIKSMEKEALMKRFNGGLYAAARALFDGGRHRVQRESCVHNQDATCCAPTGNLPTFVASLKAG